MKYPSITKPSIRKSILTYRKLLAKEIFMDRNDELCIRLRDLIDALAINILHVFLPIKRNNEPDITQLLKELWAAEKKILVSKTDFALGTLAHYQLEPTTVLKENDLNIPEPQNAAPADIAQCQMVLVPLLLADKKGNRIGYGGGYYDRLLSETNGVKVGLCLSFPVDEIIQFEDWDVPLDYLITPNKLYKYG